MQVEMDSANLGRQRVTIDPLGLLDDVHREFGIERVAPAGVATDQDWMEL